MFKAKHALLDGVLLLGIVVLLNCLALPSDPGLISWNPSPYVFVPIFLGARFGFRAAMLGALAVCALVLGGRHGILGLDLEKDVQTLSIFLASTFVYGAVAGEVQGFFHRQITRLTANNDRLDKRVRKLTEEFKYLRETKDELQRAFAVRDNEHASFDTEIRRLFSLSGEDLYRGILVVLNRQARVGEAAIYLVEDESEGGSEGAVSLVRKSFLGSDKDLPESFALQELEIISQCFRSRQTVRLSEAWKTRQPGNESHLLAQPFLRPDGKPFGVLLITAIPFIAMNEKTVRKIVTVCRWASQVIELKLFDRVHYRLVKGFNDKKVFFPDYYRNAVRTAFYSYQEHRIPSAIVSLRVLREGSEYQAYLEEAVMGTVRDGDYACQFPGLDPHLHILLPLTGERGASIFMERCKALVEKQGNLTGALEFSLIKLDEVSDVEHLLTGLTQSLVGGDNGA